MPKEKRILYGIAMNHMLRTTNAERGFSHVKITHELIMCRSLSLSNVNRVINK